MDTNAPHAPTDAPTSYLVGAEHESDWHVYVPEGPDGPVGYCLRSQEPEEDFNPASATAELVGEGWAVVGEWVENPLDEGEYQWTARVTPCAPVPWTARDEALGELDLAVAVPADLADALRAVLDERLSGTGVDTRDLSLDLARTATGWTGRYRPGVVL